MLVGALEIFNDPGQQPGQFLLDLGIGDADGLDMLFGNDDHINSVREFMLMQSKKFFENTFDSIAFDCFSDFFTHGCSTSQTVNPFTSISNENDKMS